jgi:[acyl-carrier-protein] S-malonyltransferase
VLAEHGVQPALAAGHSLGEWSAHVPPERFSFADAVRAVKARGRAMQLAVPAGQGAMAAILSLDPPLVAEACQEAAAETGLTVQPPTSTPPTRPSSPALLPLSKRLRRWPRPKARAAPSCSPSARPSTAR